MLLLAAYKNDDLAYVGGPARASRKRLRSRCEMLDKLKTSRPAVQLKRTGVVWVQPGLIAEIEYRAWTEDGKLRHASYKGLREKQDNADVFKLDVS